MVTVVENADYSFRFDERANGVWLVCFLRGRRLIETKIDSGKLRILRDWLSCLEIK